MTINILYFAWVKDKVGITEETIVPPQDIRTVLELINWLTERSEGHAAAFAKLDIVRAAIDQKHVSFDAMIRNAKEIAFFPPITGG